MTDEEKDVYISDTMKKFKLVDMREQYQEIISEAKETSMDYQDFLLKLLIIEEEGKTNRRIEMLRNTAGFDNYTRLSDVDYSFNRTLDKDKITWLGKLEFINSRENIIIIGPPGVGKTMIATGIGYNACDAGYNVMFANAKELVDLLYDEMLKGDLQKCGLSTVN